ncbi:hypothetical protein HCN52_23320, partial [Streptomyces bohaiensis]|nr:hypothetical protein [Streptomyces bohaiensis]
MTDAPRLDRLLASRPGRDAWDEVCELLERCDEPRLAAVSAAVLRWPAAQRPMPDRWWAQWTRGDVRPYHALAGTRGLGGLDSVETGTVPRPVEEDWADWADQADLADLAALSGLLGPLRPAPPATEPGADGFGPDGFGADGFAVPGPAAGGPGDDLPPPGVLPGADGLFPLHRGAEPRLFGGPLDGSGVPGLDTPYAYGDPGPPGLGAPPGLGVPRFPDDPDDPDDAHAADDVLGLPPAGLTAGGRHETTAGLDQGAAAVAAPASLRWLAVAGRATSAARGGDLVRWETTRDAPLVRYLNGAETTDEPTEVQVSPDGEVVVTAVEGGWAAWSAATGRRLWLLGPEENGTAAGGRGSDSLDDPVRLAFSGDGRRLAFGTTGSDVVAVVDSRTGEPLLSVEPGADAFGPVALDAHGRLLAHVAHGGRVVLRDVATGEVVAAGESGLTSVAALALAPDGHAVFAVGGAVGGGPGDAGLTVRARPAARLLS